MMIPTAAPRASKRRLYFSPRDCLLYLGLALVLWQSTSAPGASEVTRADPEYEAPQTLTAAIYERGTDRRNLLFRFKRQATRSGSRLNVIRDFAYPDGKLAVQEVVVYEGDKLASYVLHDFQTGAEGSANIRRAPGFPTAEGTIQFDYRKSPGSPRKERSEPLRDNCLVGDMVGPFLADHWSALMRGDKLKTRYIAVPRMETVGFTFLKEAATDPKNPQAVLIKMEPTSRIIAAIVDPLFFSVEKAPPHRVLQYNGRTTPKLSIRGNWEDLDAITVFEWK